jgi:PAS domain S-box-containing protein
MAADNRKKLRTGLIYSLRVRLMVMSFILILLPMTVAAWSVMYLVQQHLNEDAVRRLQSDLSVASLYYQGQVDKVRSSILTVAMDNMVKTTLRLEIYGQLRKHIDELAVRHGLDFLLIVDPQGNVRISSLLGHNWDVDLSEVNLAAHPVIASVAGNGTTSGSLLEENGFLLHLLERGGKDIDFKPVVLIEAAAGITLRDRVLGTVLGGIMVTDNRELLQRLETAVGAGRVEVVAADRMAAGCDLFAPDRGRRQVFFPDKLDYVHHSSPGVENTILDPVNGGRMVYDYQPLSMPGRDAELALVAERPLADLLNVLADIRRALFLVFAAAVLAALGAAFIMSRSIARPLHEIAGSMRKMQQGEKVVPLECRRDDEIGDLVSGYNDMTQALEARIQELGNEISTRKQAEKNLAAESERLRVTVQSMDDAVLAVDTEGRLVLMNKVAEYLTGKQMGEAVGRPVDEILILKNMEENGERVDPLTWLQDDNQDRQSFMDLQLSAPGGEDRIVSVSGSRIIDNRKKILGAVLIIRDVTGQRKMEEEIARGQKLESVGVLAGGIAHDFNNLLTAILGNLSLARIVSSPDEAHYKNIEDAEKASLRARELTRQLLTFSRGGSPVKGSVNLKELVRESAEFVVRGSNVRLRFTAEKKLWPVHVDRGQIGQVVDNLVINSMQAMPDGGFIEIRIANDLAGENETYSLTGHRYVRIDVQDYGTGISKEQQARIFDPYFTTKDVGNGLGLAICYSIVKKHGGHIIVTSESGRGSVFSVYLPAVEPDREEEKQVDGNRELLQAGTNKRILIMDDEEMVCIVVCSFLEYLGYEVDTASDGAAALDLYRQALDQGRRFDAVILDLTVPGGMGGKKTVGRLLEIDPSALVLVSSGYSSHKIMTNYTQYGFAGVVVKPFRINELNRVLKEVLGE